MTPQAASSVITAPPCGRTSRAPDVGAPIRCIASTEVPLACAICTSEGPSGSSAMLVSPEAEPAIADRREIKPATETSGPPPMVSAASAIRPTTSDRD